MKIFVDTSFLIAIYDTSDQYHKQSITILKKISSQNPDLITSDYTYDETITYLLNTHTRFGYLRATKFDEDVNDPKKFNLIMVNDILFQKSRTILKKYDKDKSWSFTDCTSFSLMKDFGIVKVLTFDKHFREMGFTMNNFD